ncbi:MAG: hypothetical protein P4L67_03590 [Candidatus Pacebacteria bacterium]|nr:hypothetical protein [Candidatus Paceibacterota bacterium]
METGEKGVRRSRMYRYLKVALVVLGVLLALLCIFLVRDYLALRRENLINARELPLSEFVKKHGPLTADETGVIRAWMTFGYINKIFGLPPDFIKDSFHITDPRYPNLTISQYAGSGGVAEADFMTSLEAAIGNRLKQSP